MNVFLKRRKLKSVGLPDHWKFFQGQCVFQRNRVSYFHGLPQGKPLAKGGVLGGNVHQLFCAPQIL